MFALKEIKCESILIEIECNELENIYYISIQ